jgi:hypothetical protein
MESSVRVEKYSSPLGTHDVIPSDAQAGTHLLGVSLETHSWPTICQYII